MIGIIIEVVLSWLLLWFVCQKPLSVLGLRPTASRLTTFGIGLLLATFCSALYHFMTTVFASNSWVVNPQASGKALAESARAAVVSVLYEELIFRGALLYIALRKIGLTNACLVSAVCFGVYHWFTFNVFGNPFMMVITFLMTAIIGLSWAYAFAKTGSLYLPIGLHFGWNCMQAVVFSNGNGPQLFVRANENKLQGTFMMVAFLFQVVALPLLTFWYLHRLSKKQKLLVEKG